MKLSRNTLGQNKEEMESKLSRKKANLWQNLKDQKNFYIFNENSIFVFSGLKTR